LEVNGQIITDKLEIANEFNNFFTDIGVKISESVKQTSAKPEEFLPNLENVQNLDLGTVNQAHICDIIKSLQTKNSCDIDGISTRFIKKLLPKLDGRLHIFLILV
jgi:hypothetical protein